MYEVSGHGEPTASSYLWRSPHVVSAIGRCDLSREWSNADVIDTRS